MNFPSIMHFHYVSSKSSIIIFHYMSTYIKHRNLKLVNKDLEAVIIREEALSCNIIKVGIGYCYVII